jgi:hypothetical protein
LIYKSADAEDTGFIDRVQLKDAMIKNKEKMNVITEEAPQPQTNSVVAQVMDTLNSTSSGTIKKREFKEALLAFNDNNQTGLDVDSIVKEIFKNEPTLDRSIIRDEMNHNQEIQNTVAVQPAEPI